MDTSNNFTALFIQYVLPVLVSLAAAAAAAALAALTKLLTARAQGSKLAAVGVKVSTFAEAIVADLNATVKPEMTERGRDGRLDAKDMTALRVMAMARLKAMLAERGLDELKGTFGIFEPTLQEFLSGIIERAVSGAKPAAIFAGSTPTVIVGSAALSPPAASRG